MEQNNIYFSQTNTKRVTSMGRFDVIIYLNVLLSLSCLVFISVATVTGRGEGGGQV